MEEIKAPTKRAETGGQTTTAAINSEELAPLTPLQLLFLTRLKEMLERQKNAGRAELWVQKALAKAVYSVFLDCVAVGAEKEARKILSEGITKTEA